MKLLLDKAHRYSLRVGVLAGFGFLVVVALVVLAWAGFKRLFGDEAAIPTSTLAVAAAIYVLGFLIRYVVLSWKLGQPITLTETLLISGRRRVSIWEAVPEPFYALLGEGFWPLTKALWLEDTTNRILIAPELLDFRSRKSLGEAWDAAGKAEGVPNADDLKADRPRRI